ncbi:MAG: pyroglutamyl-peptidase I [Chloracidobacterium sp.]|nr:pyroglutamyl-peptidase I [Chloracidobacterium sp.]MDW8218778.1 pyroglutamyl-peptidase I [Acidobacteriota bacterium]
MIKLLVTGFEPFATFSVNPTQTLALTADAPEGVHLTRLILPVVAGECAARLLRAIEDEQPTAVVSLGLAAGRKAVSLERIAVNCDDFQTPDNAGNLRRDALIAPNGPPALWTTLPIRRMEAALQNERIPVEISYSAGTYVCNHLFYAVQYELLRRGVPCRYGFVHLPPTPDMEAHGLPLTTQRRAVTRLLETLRDTDESDVWPLPEVTQTRHLPTTPAWPP